MAFFENSWCCQQLTKNWRQRQRSAYPLHYQNKLIFIHPSYSSILALAKSVLQEAGVVKFLCGCRLLSSVSLQMTVVHVSSYVCTVQARRTSQIVWWQNWRGLDASIELLCGNNVCHRLLSHIFTACFQAYVEQAQMRVMPQCPHCSSTPYIITQAEAPGPDETEQHTEALSELLSL